MSNLALASEHPADEAPDPAVLRAERRLRLLEELAEIGMELARALRPGPVADQASQGAASGKGRDPADAFAGLSRAIRLTFALEARTDQDLRDLKAGVIRERQEERACAVKRAQIAAFHAFEGRKDQVRGLVGDIAEAESEDAGEFENLLAALDERLEEDEAYWDLDERPLRETVERLCKDLTLNPDWSRWESEDWTFDASPAQEAPPQKAPTRPRFSRFNQPSARPIGNAPPLTLVPSQGAARHLE